MEAGGHVDGSGGGGGRWTVFILLANGCYTSSNATRGRGVEVAVHNGAQEVECEERLVS